MGDTRYRLLLCVQKKKKKKKKKKSKNVKKREEESGEICWKAKQTAHVRDCSDATGGCCGSIRLTSDRLK